MAQVLHTRGFLSSLVALFAGDVWYIIVVMEFVLMGSGECSSTGMSEEVQMLLNDQPGEHTGRQVQELNRGVLCQTVTCLGGTVSAQLHTGWTDEHTRALIQWRVALFTGKRNAKDLSKYTNEDLKCPQDGEVTAASWKWCAVLDEAIGGGPSITPPNLIASSGPDVAVTSPSSVRSTSVRSGRKRKDIEVRLICEMEEKEAEREIEAVEREERREREDREREERRDREMREGEERFLQLLAKKNLNKKY
ncbi:hypothetical protein DPX16_3534 [Anabarilius grahami]|uniref:Uncharacterized protein n=1 Tax=Anabarilius grahami TaxID=495550 RepID=A0A3N0YXP1_ANAGA|nr:hypothetical protein DPX16_3534 [Anabarilius grahami]